jgi:hypothetical protein
MQQYVSLDQGPSPRGKIFVLTQKCSLRARAVPHMDLHHLIAGVQVQSWNF